MICSFECTFCRTCVEQIIENVCPNCGGGFSPRPVRPKHDWRNGDYLGTYPASSKEKHRPVDLSLHRRTSGIIKAIPPEKR